MHLALLAAPLTHPLEFGLVKVEDDNADGNARPEPFILQHSHGLTRLLFCWFGPRRVFLYSRVVGVLAGLKLSQKLGFLII